MGAKYDQLNLDERIEMSRLYEAGTSRREIGRIIGRSASTVGRKLRDRSSPCLHRQLHVQTHCSLWLELAGLFFIFPI